MFEPTKGEYGRPIWTPNDPVVKTADGKPIVHGMRVFTNNLDLGVVDLTGELTGRAATYEWHGPENRWVLWFDTVIDTNWKGETVSDRCLQSHDRVATRYNGREAATEGNVRVVRGAVIQTLPMDDPSLCDSSGRPLTGDELEAQAAKKPQRRRSVQPAPSLTDALDVLRKGL